MIHEHWHLYATMDGKYQTVGYVVNKLLDEVHMANKEQITSVTLSWIRYITDCRI